MVKLLVDIIFTVVELWSVFLTFWIECALPVENDSHFDSVILLYKKANMADRKKIFQFISQVF